MTLHHWQQVRGGWVFDIQYSMKDTNESFYNVSELPAPLPGASVFRMHTIVGIYDT